MDLRVYPGHPLRGEVFLPGDKSISHRAALFAGLAQGESWVENFLVAGVTRSMLSALSGLGVTWSLEGETLRVQGRGLRGMSTPRQVLYCGHSGTTMRLLAGALAASGVAAVLDGSPGLRRRPMERIVRPMQAMGVPIQAAPGGGAPLRLEARPPERPLHALEYQLPVASAQVKTALLLAGLAADGPVTLVEPGPSRDHSERMLASMGARIDFVSVADSGRDPEYTPSTIILHPLESDLHPLRMSLPGDFSSAAFLIVAALITPGSEVVLREVGLNPTRTGLLDVLRSMGADIQVTGQEDRHGEPVGDICVEYTPLNGVHVAGSLVVRMIDEFPVFAVAAALADGRTSVRDALELRYKESDRIAALAQGLRALSVGLEETPDGFDLEGGKIPGGESVPSWGDHRLAMSLAVAGMAAEQPVTIRGAEIIAQSYPQFSSTLQSLGAGLEWVEAP